jgi:hypothetical protein
MLLSSLSGLIPLAIVCVFVFIPTVSIVWFRNFQTKNKKNPLNLEMLREPGHSLRQEIEDTSDGIMDCVFFLSLVPIYIYAVVVTQYALSAKSLSLVVLLIYLVASLGILIHFSRKIYNLLKKRNDLRLGYDCELMTGQELAGLIKDGFKIFHDFPAGTFNIDHIAVGPTGIFAIETKGRAKNKVAEKKNWEVQFDGKQLVFPEWTETKPIAQTINQAKWLKKWIHQATGIECKVDPVLVLPGWYIKRTGPSDVKVYNGKNPFFLAKGTTLMTPQQIQAVSFQIEQKCRTVSHSAYRNDNDKNKK